MSFGFSGPTTLNIVGTASDDVLTLTTSVTVNQWVGTIDGGAGTDTLRLTSDFYTGYFDLTDLSVFSGVEIIRATSYGDIIWLRDDQLKDVVTIDGGASVSDDVLGLEGTNFDFRTRTILNIDRINLVSDNAVVMLGDKATAFKLRGFGQNDHLIINGVSLTPEEREALHANGIDKITYADGAVSINETPVIANLNGSSIRTLPGQAVLLDAGADAAITDDDGVISSLSVRIAGQKLPTESIGIDTAGAVRLSDGLFAGSKVSVDGTEIGTIYSTPGEDLSVVLTNGATPELVNKLVRAITYVNLNADPAFAAHRTIVITASDDGMRKGTATIGVTVGASNVIALTSGVDTLSGTAADEVFVSGLSDLGAGDALDGGAGFDTLRFSAPNAQPWDRGTYDFTKLGAFRGIEKVQGSDAEEIFAFNAQTLSSVRALDGGKPDFFTMGDTLVLHGPSLDLRGKTVSNIETISFADSTATLLISDPKLATFISGQGGKNIWVILDRKTFTDLQRHELESNGVKKITDASGTYTSSGYRPPTTPGTNIGGSGSAELLAGGSGADTIKGAGGHDKIYGSDGHDTLFGDSGNDVIRGEKGKDVLKGGSGRDAFVFDTKPNKSSNLDKILDFKVADDSIWLDNVVFTKLGKSGTEKKPAQLLKDFFVVGPKAKDKDDYIVYDKAKGVLYYDADGSGKGKAVEIAALSKKLAMTYKDFFVI
ncbi:calcium-binding protein [Microvirga zambiensis]|uniref:calcium-binding protein n=1 Tax=Microvirga zambiensis TaxID=1402137 RepID=UPI00191FDF39|nr:calcium-binding protein [Microvirga zambiensis]